MEQTNPKIGSIVTLASNGIPGFGGLNATFLREEGYHGQPLEIEAEAGCTTVNGRYWQVTLPSGYRLDIHRRDILTIR